MSRLRRPSENRKRLLVGLVACTLAAALCLSAPALCLEDGRRLVGGEHLEVRYWPEHEDIALKVREQSLEDIKILSHYLDLKVKGTILVEIVRSHAEFNQRVGKRMFTWTQGVSLHHSNHVIIKPLTGNNLRRLVAHELTHVALDMKMARTRGEPPRWLHEGLAQWMEGDMAAVRKDILGRASVSGELLGLGELEDAFKGDRETVDLAYAQSHTLVSFILDNGPPGALGRFLQYLMDTGDEDQSLRRCMGLPLDTIEKRWLQHIRTTYLSRGVPLSAELLIFAAMGLLFLAAVMLKLNRAREIRERMQAEEQFEQLMAGLELSDDFEGPVGEDHADNRE